MNSVYINATTSFFPNAPVHNDEIEPVLGFVGDRPSRARKIILESNQIKTRYYAIDPKTRKPTHTNAQLTAECLKKLFTENAALRVTDADLLCTGTSSPDLLFPAHANMVHGEWPEFKGEVTTLSGVCTSSVAALKMAYTSILAGTSQAALVTGSEVSSKFLRSEFFNSENFDDVERLHKDKAVAFESDFLRWMLSDGAACCFLSTRKIANHLNLRINWIEGRSYADQENVCMFAGGVRSAEGDVISWKDARLLNLPPEQRTFMNASQDIRILRNRICELTVEKPLTEIKKKRGLHPGDYRWLIPHYSSHYFRNILSDVLKKIDFDIPMDRWFTTISKRGNMGAASIFAYLHDLTQSEKLNPGDKILCYVPESSRFSTYYFELEVV